jgi:hypothetical protein
MSDRNTPISEWDDAEQAEETSNHTLAEFLGHAAVNLWPVLLLAAIMVAVGIWFDHYP